MATKQPSEAHVHAWATMLRAQRVALDGVEEALKEADLPPLAWYDVLLELERFEGQGLRPYELEHALLLAQSNLSRLLERMERAGYVGKSACEDDRRGHRIAITAAGKRARRRMWPVYAGAIQSAVGDRLSEAEARTLTTLLAKLVDAKA